MVRVAFAAQVFRAQEGSSFNYPMAFRVGSPKGEVGLFTQLKCCKLLSHLNGFSYSPKLVVMHVRIILLLTIFTLSDFPIATAQCMMVPLSLQQRVEQSAWIVLGQPVEQHPYIGSDGHIYTFNRIAVSAWLKNAGEDAELGVITFGGVLHDRAELVHPALRLSLDNEYVIFLKGDELELDNKTIRQAEPSLIQSFAYSDGQGALTYQFGKYSDAYHPQKLTEEQLFAQISSITGETAFTPDGEVYIPRPWQNNPHTERANPITSFSPNPTNSGTIASGDFLSINGSGFGASPGNVYFPNADDGGSTLVATGVASDYVSWSDTHIEVKVLTDGGTGTFEVNSISSGSSLTIDYSHLSINSDFYNWSEVTRQRYYLRDMDGSGGYTFLYNSTVQGGFSNHTLAKAAFERALETWRCNTFINWRGGGTTTSGVANDNLSVVTWSTTLPAGVLGRATSYFTGSGNASCQQANTVWCLDEADVAFDSTYNWEYGPAMPSPGEYDFETVSLHELGHAHGLGHRIAPGELMHYALSSGIAIRTPASKEISGGNAKMAYSTSATCFNPSNCGNGPMTALTSGNCALPVELISFHAELVDDGVLLTWQTASEWNNDRFDVERSGADLKFQRIGQVQGAGTTLNYRQYAFTDPQPLNGPNYYRLRQIDFDGSSTFSPYVFVEFEPKRDFSRLYPNPVSQSGPKLEIYTSEPGPLTLQVYNLAGLLLGSYKYKINEGYNLLSFMDKQLCPGVYQLFLTKNGERKILKFVVH